jgi:LysM repeat protein
MTLVKLAEELTESAETEGHVTLDSAVLEKAGLTPPANLDALVARSFQEPKLVLATTADQIGQATETQLTMTGALTALGVTEVKSTVVFTAAGAAVSFTLEAPLPSDWTLATSFSGLASFPFESVKLSQPGYLFSTGKVSGYAWPGGAVDLEAGLNLASFATVGGSLAPLLALVPGAPAKPLLHGTIDPGAGPLPSLPDVNLEATMLEGALPDIGFLELSDADLGLVVKTQATTTGKEQYPSGYLSAVVGAPGTELKLACLIEAKKTLSALRLAVGPPEGKAVTIPDVFALMGGRTWYSTIPAPLQALFTSIGFKGLEAEVTTVGGKSQLNSISATVGSIAPWPLFANWQIDSVDFLWSVVDPLGEAQVQGEFGGTAHFYPKLFTEEFYASIDTEMLVVAGYDGTITLSKVLELMSPGTVLPAHMDVALSDFQTTIESSRSAFSLGAVAEASMDILGNGTLQLLETQLFFASAPNSTRAALNGSLVIGGTVFALEATYEDGAWHFDGGLQPGQTIELGALVDDLLAEFGLPSFVPETLEVAPLWLTVDVPGEPQAKGTYHLVAGTTWRLDAPGSVLNGLELGAEVDLTYTGKTEKTTGLISGEAKLPLPIPGMTFDVTLAYEMASTEELLWAEWHGFAKAVYSLTKDEVTFKLQESSLGSLLTDLVRIIEGEPKFTLPAPWNLLEQISLKAFSVIWRLNPEKGQSAVQVEYDFEGNNIDLYFIEIESLGFTTKDGKVQISLSAKLLGQTKFEEMEFPATEPPPAPGQDSTAFELDLLALGQRVSVQGLKEATKVAEATKILESFKPPKEANALPVPANPEAGQPYYEPESAWLVGTRFKVLVDKQTGVALLLLEAVFNDPQLYGIRLALAGDKAGPLEGLEFEILYRKVSDTVGVYQIELTLPKSMRQIQLGAVAVTLPVVGVQVYTNGDFRVDFGFPANMDFSRSAGVEAFPFLGQGGFYFGALSSETAGENVPATTRGTFDPVYVFGLGLRIGLGKSLDEGIFSAELSVTVFGIVEGVLATFNPNEQDSETTTLPAAVGAQGTALEGEYYWWLQGTVGLIGKVEGTVDFAIITASVNVTVQALIQFTVEAYRSIPVHVEAGVSVGITVKINLGLFSIHLHFSFNLTVKADFLIGSDSRAPWDETSLAAAERYSAPLPPPSPRTFSPLAVEEKIPLDLYAAPQLTLADWTTEPAPQAAYVAMLYLEIPVGEASGTPTAFEQLARETLLWALTNFGETAELGRGEALASEVTRRQVEEAYAHFAATGGPPPVSWSEIREFLEAHFELSVVEPVNGLESAGAMPMLPDLTLQIPAWEGNPGRTVDFATESTCGPEYLDALQKLLAELEVQLQTELEKKHESEKRATMPGEAPEQSLATFIAEDWFALLCRYMLQSSLDAFDSYAYVLPGELSLEEIVDVFPGNDLTVEAVGAANAGLPLAPKAAISISGVTHTVAAADTLGKIAAEYGLEAVALVEANPDLQGLLAEGTALTVKGAPYLVGPRDTFAKIEAATGASAAEVAAAVSAAGEGALVTLAALAVPEFSHEAAADGSDTLTSLSGRYGVDAAAIAAANAKTRPLFEYEAGKTFVDVPGLTTMSAQLLTEELHGSQVYANLAGISTRFLLDGLRLPEIDDATQTRGLQSLTGQQVTLPKLEAADAGKYSLTLGRGAEGGWIELGADGRSLAMTIDQKQIEWIDAVLAGATPAIEPDTLAIAAMAATAGVKRQFNLNAATPLRLPAGLAMPGEKSVAPTLLLMPDALLTVLADPERARPAFSLQRADPGSGGVPVVKPVESSSWGTVVSVTVNRIPDAPAGSYELVGTDQTGIVLLERLLEQVGSGSNPIFGTPQVLFPPSATDPQPTGLIGGDPATVSSYIVQANLSTETNPQRLAATLDVSETATKTVVNTPEEFARLLWECSIVASGGYYFHYESAPGSPGLPDYLFNPHGEASFQVLIQLEDQEEGLGRYVNAAVVGESIDPSRTTVFAQSEPRTVEHVLAEADSLASIAAGLHLTVPELAVQLADVPLKPNGPQLAIEWALYETRAGDTLQGIAAAFGTTPAAIEAANADLRIDWSNLPPWTLLRIPPVTTSVGASGPATLGQLAAAYSLDVETLGWLNQGVSGIFKVTGTPVQIVDEIVDATAVLPPSVAGFTVERRPLESGDEVDLYLDSTFNLLGWQLIENAGFRASPSGLPVSPGEPMDEEELAQLRAERPAPQASTGGGTLVYEQLFPVTSYAKDAPQSGDEHVPPAEADPYAGIGFAAQPRLEWRDLFGNRARTPLTEPALDPTGPANQPPVPIAYADRLLGLGQWPGAGATYTVGKGGEGAQIEVAISFETQRYEGGGEAAQQLAEADRETYATAYYQLNQEGADGTAHVTVELTTTLDDGEPHVLTGAALESVKQFVLAAWQYLDDLIGHLEGRVPAAPAAPPGREFAVPVADTNPADVFELTVVLALVRDPRLVAAESRDEDGVARVEAALVAVGAAEDETASLLPFAEAFEKTFEAPPVVVKLAVGTSREEEADAAGAHRLWAVRTSTDLSAGIGARVSGQAWYYAPPPLSTALVSRNGVKVPVFEAGKGVVSETLRDFTDVDLDVWAREALQAIDGVLSPAAAVPAFVVDSVAGTAFLERLREAKKTLAKAISGRVVNVLDDPAEDPAGLLAARERWEQQLLVTLSSAYQTDVAVQLPVEVHGGGEEGFLPPELYGHISMPEEQAKYCTATTFKIDTAKEKGYLTFMFAASDPAAQRSVHVDAGYALDMIEHQISGVPGIEGYRASSWLSFPIPLGSLPLDEPEYGSLDVPVVLRAYPTPPTLGKQTMRADLDATNDRTAVETAARWTFLADYDQIHVAQDVIDAEAEFNIPGAAALTAEDRAEDMFEALARLLSILPELQTVFETQLAGLTTQTPQESPEFVASEQALAAFVELTERVAALWGVLNPDPTSTGVASGGGMRFDIEETPYDAEGGEDLLVTVGEEGEAPPGVPAPLVEIEGFEGVPTEKGLRYRQGPQSPYLGYEEGERIPGRTVAIGPLDGFTLQNARLGLQITRNADLVPGNPTQAPFVYTTPMVQFPSVCTPLLDAGEPIDVAAVATGSRRQATLTEHLQSLFSTLFATAPEGRRTLQLQALYRLPMEGDPLLPPAVLPIKLAPAVEFDVPAGWEKGGFAEQLAESLLEWLRDHEAAADAALGFEISVFSSLEGTALPTVRLGELYLRLADVTDA